MGDDNFTFLSYFERMGYYIDIVDQYGYLTYTTGYEDLWNGSSKNEAIGMHASKVFFLSENASPLQYTLKTKLPYHTIIRYEAINRQIFWWLCDVSPIIKNKKLHGAISIAKLYSYDFNFLASLNSKSMKPKANKSITPDSSIRINANNTVYCFDNIIYASQAMDNLVKMAKVVAQNTSSVLIVGETGTGKEIIAQSIHNTSPLAKGNFMAVNCSAIPNSLIESILFGTVKGAYTGATDNIGFFEAANNGTLFLDEINSMSLEMQSKLLRALQTMTIQRVGSTKSIHIKTRIISAININPIICMEQKLLRNDLFYRLAAVYIDIPPLKDRKEDIDALTDYYIDRYNRIFSKNITRIDNSVRKLFMEYKWCGNVRELQHLLEHSFNVVSNHERSITVKHLPKYFLNQIEASKLYPLDTLPAPQTSFKDARKSFLEYAEQSFTQIYINKALAASDYNVSKTATTIGITRRHLHALLKKYNITSK